MTEDVSAEAREYLAQFMAENEEVLRRLARHESPTDCRRCGHPGSRHEAGECWTNADGRETHDDPACPCSWYEPCGETR